MVNIITTIGGIASSVMAVVALAILLIKPVRNRVRRSIESDSVFKQNTLEAFKCLIRHSITSIYYQYRDQKQIPEYEYQNLIALIDKYNLFNGNTYVKDIVQIMHTWKRIE